jgi:Na+/proline symporter
MKAVIWTDLFQFGVMYAGVLAAFIKVLDKLKISQLEWALLRETCS